MRTGHLAAAIIATLLALPPPAAGQAPPGQSPPGLSPAGPAALATEERPPPPTEPSVPNVPGAEKAPPPPPAKAAKAVRPADEAPKRKRRPGRELAGQAPLPAPDVLLMMLRGVMAAVNQANFTENYTVLHGLMTPPVQDRIRPAQFARAFGGLRRQNLDLSPTLVLAPQFSEPPAVSPKNELRLTGHFATRPQQIEFTVVWRPFDNVWLVDTLTVSARPAPAAAQGGIPVLADTRPGAAAAPPPASTPSPASAPAAATKAK